MYTMTSGEILLPSIINSAIQKYAKKLDADIRESTRLKCGNSSNNMNMYFDTYYEEYERRFLIDIEGLIMLIPKGGLKKYLVETSELQTKNATHQAELDDLFKKMGKEVTEINGELNKYIFKSS